MQSVYARRGDGFNSTLGVEKARNSHPNPCVSPRSDLKRKQERTQCEGGYKLLRVLQKHNTDCNLSAWIFIWNKATQNHNWKGEITHNVSKYTRWDWSLISDRKQTIVNNLRGKLAIYYINTVFSAWRSFVSCIRVYKLMCGLNISVIPSNLPLIIAMQWRHQRGAMGAMGTPIDQSHCDYHHVSYMDMKYFVCFFSILSHF